MPAPKSAYFLRGIVCCKLRGILWVVLPTEHPGVRGNFGPHHFALHMKDQPCCPSAARRKKAGAKVASFEIGRTREGVGERSASEESKSKLHPEPYKVQVKHITSRRGNRVCPRLESPRSIRISPWRRVQCVCTETCRETAGSGTKCWDCRTYYYPHT